MAKLSNLGLKRKEATMTMNDLDPSISSFDQVVRGAGKREQKRESWVSNRDAEEPSEFGEGGRCCREAIVIGFHCPDYLIALQCASSRMPSVALDYWSQAGAFKWIHSSNLARRFKFQAFRWRKGLCFLGEGCSSNVLLKAGKRKAHS